MVIGASESIIKRLLLIVTQLALIARVVSKTQWIISLSGFNNIYTHLYMYIYIKRKRGITLSSVSIQLSAQTI